MFKLVAKNNLTIIGMNNEIAIETHIPCEEFEQGEMIVNATIFLVL